MTYCAYSPFQCNCCRSSRFYLPIFGELRFNPVVSFLAICIIWSFVGICVAYGDAVPFGAGTTWIVENFTWLYLGSQVRTV